MFIAGLDLGQSADYTALAILEVLPGQPATYHCRHLERFQLGTPYPAIVDQVLTRLSVPALRWQTSLVVDQTGVGRPVVDMLRAASTTVEGHPFRLQPIAVTITGGDAVGRDGRDYRVPKRELVSVLQVLLQTERLKFAASLPEAPRLVQEMLAFQVKITTAANDIYGSWREGSHDDLVLAVALATWYADRVRPRPMSAAVGGQRPQIEWYGGAVRRGKDTIKPEPPPDFPIIRRR